MLARGLVRSARLALATAAAGIAVGNAHAYPGGTPDYQTDAAPFCASCHSSVDAAELAGAPGDRATKELAANKHIAQIEAGAPNTGYAALSEGERKALATQIRALDAATKVRLSAPAQVAPGQVFTVEVTFTGGGGPVAGIALVDAAHRWYARPAPSAGWQIAEQPVIRVGVTGSPAGAPAGGEQPEQKWLDKRPAALGRNLAYVNVLGIKSNVDAQSFGEGMVTWKVKAPMQPGSYPLTAAYFYGTELATPLGYTVDPADPLKRAQVRGGFTGASGRVAFTAVQQITVALP
jgi:cytochrome c553